MSKKILEIRLKSDLCMGSGYAYAGLIDTDICYNENGIPYIPGRRIKGCLRDVAKYMFDEQEIENIFGKRDDRAVKGIVVSNAYPTNMEMLNDEITQLKKADSPYKEYITQQKVLDIFTRVKAQTAIDEDTGVALDNSLRFMRVVNQYSVMDEEEMAFYAEIEYDCVKDEDVEKLAKALRHIGMSRNRGLGNVKCRILDCNIDREAGMEVVDNASGLSDEMVMLKYVFTNTQPLMLSADDDSKSENYINGQSMLGALAGAYLKLEGKDDGDEFKDIFLRGKVNFHNAYITDENDNEYIPAPLYLRKLKKTKRIVNVIKEYSVSDGDDYKCDNGNQPKKITSKYVNLAKDGSVRFVTPKVSLIYHHTHKNGNNDEKLYSFRVLAQNQRFAGKIVGPKKYIDILESLLKNMTLRFGKSKTAQYGECRVEKIEINKLEAINVSMEDEIVVTLESDGIFIDNNMYTNRYDQVKKTIARQLGLNIYESEEENTSYMKTKVITGYNTKWNMKKASLPAVGAGSSFVFKLKEPVVVEASMVGERNLEGYGVIRVDKTSSMKYKVEEKVVTNETTVNVKEAGNILERILINDLLDVIKLNAYSMEDLRLNGSTIGRISLMLMESGKDYEDFLERIDSIKRKGEHDNIMDFVYKYIFNQENKPDLTKMIRKSDEGKKISLVLDELFKEEKEQKKQQVADDIWQEYLKSILVNQKYKLAKGEM